MFNILRCSACCRPSRMWITFHRFWTIFEAFVPHFYLCCTHCIFPKSLLSHLNSFLSGMFKLNAKFDADLLIYLLSHATATQYSCSLNVIYHPHWLVHEVVIVHVGVLQSTLLGCQITSVLCKPFLLYNQWLGFLDRPHKKYLSIFPNTLRSGNLNVRSSTGDCLRNYCPKGPWSVSPGTIPFMSYIVYLPFYKRWPFWCSGPNQVTKHRCVYASSCPCCMRRTTQGGGNLLTQPPRPATFFFLFKVYFIDYATPVVPFFFSPLYPSLPGIPIPSSTNPPPLCSCPWVMGSSM